MGKTDQTVTGPYTLQSLIIGLVVGVAAGVALIWTDTHPESLSIPGIGLSFVFGLLTVFADRIEPLGRIFERGQWLMIGIAVFLLLAAAQGVFSSAQWISLTLGFSVGVVFPTVGIGTKQLVSQ